MDKGIGIAGIMHVMIIARKKLAVASPVDSKSLRAMPEQLYSYYTNVVLLTSRACELVLSLIT
ncbi:hypothetical protein [Neptunomonas sp.]|uniref:hypothetical protein n=1 Tax=Neptunomonas sp. TaxID=1971898 RepID=UPI0025F0AA2F|nr:hypothetical protein [Neptunomonas sp.]